VSGKGHLTAEPGEGITFEAIGKGVVIQKLRFRYRLLQELRFGAQLARQARRVKPDVVLVSNVPIPTLVPFVMALLVMRTPWVLWHQDVQAIAIRSFAGNQLSRAFRAVATAIEIGERWCARRARHVVVIADSFVPVHRAWRTEDKVSVIPNWAPLDEIYPVDRKNDWAVEQRLDDHKTLLYSGTLGLKHNPALLVSLARRVIDAGQPVELVVVNEGPAVELLREEATRADVPVKLLPFQPYERLPEVLGTGDILVVLLEQSAGAFSVPSKTLSYLCAGRPVLGLMPNENLAAQLVDRAEGCVQPPTESSLPKAADWAVAVLGDPEQQAALGAAARDLAEREFSLEGCAGRFEELLLEACAHIPPGPTSSPAVASHSAGTTAP
jgi:glycosyltransferase involved in cell wall biosynthesis